MRCSDYTCADAESRSIGPLIFFDWISIENRPLLPRSPPRHDPPSRMEIEAQSAQADFVPSIAPGFNPEEIPEPAQMLDSRPSPDEDARHRRMMEGGSESWEDSALGSRGGAKWGWWGEVGRISDLNRRGGATRRNRSAAARRHRLGIADVAGILPPPSSIERRIDPDPADPPSQIPVRCM